MPSGKNDCRRTSESALRISTGIYVGRVNTSTDVVASKTSLVTWPLSVAGRGLQFLLLTFTGAAAALAGRAISPMQETMRVALSLSDNQMALLQGPALALPVVIAAIPLGFFIDRYTRVRLLMLFTALSIFGSVLTAVASGFAMLFLARCLVGLAMTAIIITGFSLLADLYSPVQRGRAKAVVVLGQYAGTSLAFALGGMLLTIFSSADGWRWAMFWLTAPLLLFVLLSIAAMREPPRTGVVIQKPTSKETFIELWRYRAVVVPPIIGIVLAEIPMFAIVTWAAPAFSRGFELAVDRVGALMATAMMVSGVLGPLIGGALADLCQRAGGPRRTMTAIVWLACLCAPAGLFAVMPTVALASVLLVVCITAVAAMIAMGVTLFTIVVPNELRGLCLAILAAVNSLFGVALAPVIVSLLSAAMGGETMIGQALSITCVLASISCAVMFELARRYSPRSSALIVG